jgi:carboxyl-terminal processing protease
VKGLFTFAIIVSASVAAGAQVASTGGTPFEIGHGSSFSASSGTAAPARESRTPAASRIISDVEEVMSLIRKNHVAGKSVDENALVKSSINSMLGELDPHSKYFDAGEFREFLGEQESEYTGTGSTISTFIQNDSAGTYILTTQKGSTSARAGLKYGDRIIAIDGVSAEELSSSAVRDKIRGPVGTFVTVTVQRTGGQTATYRMMRERVPQPTIPDHFMLNPTVGYIGLTEGFGHGTFAELEQALDELHRAGARSIVLDLRGNTGGILEQAIKVAAKFLPRGDTVISQRGRYSADDRRWNSTSPTPESMPLVVLVDRNTASAAEVVAGALQDNDRALLVGENTFGKGLVQNVIELPTGSGMTLTTARYYTPSGRSIQRSYTGAGRYAYFATRDAGQDDKSANIQARTITNRPVYGGHGLVPDETVAPSSFNAASAALQDPIFFFLRDNLRANSKPEDSAIYSTFRSYAETKWKIAPASLDAHQSVVLEQLRYQYALSTEGFLAAERLRIAADPQIARALNALPQAARLSESASKVRVSTANKNTRQVAFPAGQGRNRRN